MMLCLPTAVSPANVTMMVGLLVGRLRWRWRGRLDVRGGLDREAKIARGLRGRCIG